MLLFTLLFMGALTLAFLRKKRTRKLLRAVQIYLRGSYVYYNRFLLKKDEAYITVV